jgi:oligoribonuclease NrnB/cAMP/cGMP phosphodiesterase (DHH superfamily)
MKCIYHSSDLDGKMSAAIVQSFNKECELVPMNYGDTFPWEKFTDVNEKVFMVDFSLQPFEKMYNLMSVCKLVWIDHHETAITESLNSNYYHKGTGLAGGCLRVGIGACQLVWQYFTDREIPLPVRALAHYDVWDHDWVDHNHDLIRGDVLDFQYGVQANLPKDLEQQIEYLKLWLNVNSRAEMRATIDEGRAILKYIRASNYEYARMHAYRTQIDGHFAIAINKGMASSLLFESLDIPDKHIRIAYCQLPSGQWTVSLYSKGTVGAVHVGNIAKKYGGGGHEHAAGFQTDKLPFEVQ